MTIISIIVAVGGSLLAGLTGCASDVSHTSIEFNYSDYDGLETKDISLGTDVNQLSMSGKISVTSGKVRLFVNVKATGKELYSKEFTSADNANVNIDIDNVGSDKDLVLGPETEKVKDLHLKLSSGQKLDRDLETLAVPNPSKPE